MLQITPIYAGLLALLFLGLSGRVIAGRYRHRVSVGDGGKADMLKRMRAQANCAEYAPFGLLLLAMAEIQGMSGGLVHVSGASLFLGRVLHAYGFGSTPQVIPARRAGMALTLAIIGIMAIANIGHALF